MHSVASFHVRRAADAAIEFTILGILAGLASPVAADTPLYTRRAPFTVLLADGPVGAVQLLPHTGCGTDLAFGAVATFVGRDAAGTAIDGTIRARLAIFALAITAGGGYAALDAEDALFGDTVHAAITGGLESADHPAVAGPGAASGDRARLGDQVGVRRPAAHARRAGV